MGDPETSLNTISNPASVATVQRFMEPKTERRNATQGSVLERIEKAAERVNAIADKFAGPRLRSKIADEQKRGAGRLLDALERELTALEECL